MAKATITFEKVATIYDCLLQCLDCAQQCTTKNRTLLRAKNRQWGTAIRSRSNIYRTIKKFAACFISVQA